MEECCVVCAEPLEWVGYGVCGHRDVCSTCIARLRFVLNDKCCCICKQECISVFITKALGGFTKVVKTFEGLQECGNFWYESNTQAFFDDKDHYTMVKAMCRLSCRVCEQTEGLENSKDFVKKGYVFKSLDLLRQHILIAHKLEMCSLCLEGRKIFICEQKLYSKAQLEQHSATGDSTVDGIGEERGGFSGHPMCHFCQRRYYGDNELYHHMSIDHYLCHICQRLHPGHYDYFHNYDDLEAHFRHEHSLCEHPDCLAKKFVVFTSDVELKRHNALAHGGNMSRSQRTAVLQIPVSFQYRRSQIHGHASPSDIMNYSNGHLSPGVHSLNRSNSVDLEARESSALHTGTDFRSVESNVSEPVNRTGQSPMRSECSGYLTRAGGTMQPCLLESAFPPLPGSKIARRKTKQRTRGPPVLVGGLSGGNESRGTSTSSSQSDMLGRIEDKAGSSSNSTVSLPNQWQQFSARERCSEGVVNVVHRASALNRSNFSLVNEDRVHDKLTASESFLVNRLENGFKLTDEVRIANKTLSDCIRSRLGDDEKLFNAFKDLSAQFRRGKLDASLYCKHITSLGLWDLVPELARLCPEPERQRNLMNAYEEGLEGKQLSALKEGQLQMERNVNPDSSDKLGEKLKKAQVPELTSVRLTLDAALRLMDRGGTNTENCNGGALFRDRYHELKGKQRAESSTSKSVSNVRSSSANDAQKAGDLLIHGDLASQMTSPSHVTKMWSCSVCTLENSDLDSQCAACGTRISCPVVAAPCHAKRTKKISKFERLRLDHDAPPQPQPPLQKREPAQKMRGGGVWKNGGGQRLVALAQREAVVEAAWRRSS